MLTLVVVVLAPCYIWVHWCLVVIVIPSFPLPRRADDGGGRDPLLTLLSLRFFCLLIPCFPVPPRGETKKPSYGALEACIIWVKKLICISFTFINSAPN